MWVVGVQPKCMGDLSAWKTFSIFFVVFFYRGNFLDRDLVLTAGFFLWGGVGVFDGSDFCILRHLDACLLACETEIVDTICRSGD